MAVYLIAFAITMFFSCMYVSTPEFALERKRAFSGGGTCFFSKSVRGCIFILLAVFPLWFITAFRYNVGTDYSFTYVPFFQATQQGLKPYDEWGFQFLNDLLANLNLSYVWLFAITGAVILFGCFRLIMKYSARPILSVALFFVTGIFFNTLNNVRQFMAIALGALAFFQKKRWKAILIILAASLFHFSALLYLFAYFFCRIRLSKTRFIVVSILAILLTPLLTSLILVLLEKSKYSYFINYSDGWSLFTFLINTVIYLLFVVQYDEKDRGFTMLAMLQLIVLTLCIASAYLQNEELWMRFIRMFTYFHLISIPMLVSRMRTWFGRFLLGAFLILIYFAYTAYTVWYIGGLEVFPYHFIFEERNLWSCL